MNQKRYFNSYSEAKAFYDQQAGDRSIGTVRKDLRAELGEYIVQYSGPTGFERVGDRIVVTLANGDSASRKTKNDYAAAVVGYKAGKLSVLSMHYEVELARSAIDRHASGEFVNFNYRNKLDGEPILVMVQDNQRR